MRMNTHGKESRCEGRIRHAPSLGWRQARGGERQLVDLKAQVGTEMITITSSPLDESGKRADSWHLPKEPEENTGTDGAGHEPPAQAGEPFRGGAVAAIASPPQPGIRRDGIAAAEAAGGLPEGRAGAGMAVGTVPAAAGL